MENRWIFPVLLVTTLLLGSDVSYVESEGSTGTHFLFVHGTSHGAWCWYKVVNTLQQAGYKATALDMSSDGRDKTSADDVKSLAQYAKPLTDFLASVSGQVVIVGHSLSGGVTLSYAMEQYPEKISKAIFIAALMPLNLQSGLTSAPPDLFPRLLAQNVFLVNTANGPSAGPTSLSPNLAVIAGVLYNESPPQDATLSLNLVDDEPFAPVNEVLYLSPSRYGRIPRFYVKTDQDNVFTDGDFAYVLTQNPPKQVFFISGSDHFPFYSKSVVFTSLIVRISTL